MTTAQSPSRELQEFVERVRGPAETQAPQQTSPELQEFAKRVQGERITPNRTPLEVVGPVMVASWAPHIKTWVDRIPGGKAAAGMAAGTLGSIGGYARTPSILQKSTEFALAGAAGEQARKIRHYSKWLRATNPTLRNLDAFGMLLSRDVPNMLAYAADQQNTAKYSWDWFMFNVGSGAGTTLPPIAGGVLAAAASGGNPVVGYAVGTTLAAAAEAGMTYDDFKADLMRRGMLESDAEEVAAFGSLAYGGVAGLIEVGNLGKFLKLGGVTGKALSGRLKQVVLTMVEEGLEEGLQGLAEYVTSKLADIDPNRPVPWDTAEWWDSMLIGAIVGGGFGLAVPQGEPQRALQDEETGEVHVDVREQQGAEAGPGQVPPEEGGPGVPPSGPAQEGTPIGEFGPVIPKEPTRGVQEEAQQLGQEVPPEREGRERVRPEGRQAKRRRQRVGPEVTEVQEAPREERERDQGGKSAEPEPGITEHLGRTAIVASVKEYENKGLFSKGTSLVIDRLMGDRDGPLLRVISGLGSTKMTIRDAAELTAAETGLPFEQAIEYMEQEYGALDLDAEYYQPGKFIDTPVGHGIITLYAAKERGEHTAKTFAHEWYHYGWRRLLTKDQKHAFYKYAAKRRALDAEGLFVDEGSKYFLAKLRGESTKKWPKPIRDVLEAAYKALKKILAKIQVAERAAGLKSVVQEMYDEVGGLDARPKAERAREKVEQSALDATLEGLKKSQAKKKAPTKKPAKKKPAAKKKAAKSEPKITVKEAAPSPLPLPLGTTVKVGKGKLLWTVSGGKGDVVEVKRPTSTGVLTKTYNKSRLTVYEGPEKPKPTAPKKPAKVLEDEFDRFVAGQHGTFTEEEIAKFKRMASARARAMTKPTFTTIRKIFDMLAASYPSPLSRAEDILAMHAGIEEARGETGSEAFNAGFTFSAEALDEETVKKFEKKGFYVEKEQAAGYSQYEFISEYDPTLYDKIVDEVLGGQRFALEDVLSTLESGNFIPDQFSPDLIVYAYVNAAMDMARREMKMEESAAVKKKFRSASSRRMIKPEDLKVGDRFTIFGEKAYVYDANGDPALYLESMSSRLNPILLADLQHHVPIDADSLVHTDEKDLPQHVSGEGVPVFSMSKVSEKDRRKWKKLADQVIEDVSKASRESLTRANIYFTSKMLWAAQADKHKWRKSVEAIDAELARRDKTDNDPEIRFAIFKVSPEREQRANFLETSWLNERQKAVVSIDARAREHEHELGEIVREMGEEKPWWNIPWHLAQFWKDPKGRIARRKYALAMLLYIDLKHSKGRGVRRNWAKLPQHIRDAVTLAQNLPPKIQALADKIAEENRKYGKYFQKLGLIRTAYDWYIPRVFDIDAERGVPPSKRLKAKNARMKGRRHDSILDGIADGLELKIDSAITAQQYGYRQMVEVQADQQFVRIGKQQGLIVDKQTEGYRQTKKVGFYNWLWVGNIDKLKDPVTKQAVVPEIEDLDLADFLKGKVYHPNLWLDLESGNIFRKEQVYVENSIADILDHVLGHSELSDSVIWEKYDKFNAETKALILMTTLFHHQAFLRSVMLGGPGRGFWSFQNPFEAWHVGKAAYRAIAELQIGDKPTSTAAVQALSRQDKVARYKMGKASVSEMQQLVLDLASQGLTTAIEIDVQRHILDQKTRWGERIDRVPFLAPFKNLLLGIRDSQIDFLFRTFGANLKMGTAVLELKHLHMVHAEKIRQDPSYRLKLARSVAEIQNADFGGLDLQRHSLRYQAATPGVMRGLRRVLLAQDWTMSNLISALKIFDRDQNTRDLAYRLWARILFRYIYAQFIFNAMMAWLDDEETVWSQYQRAWDAGNLKIMTVDLTGLMRQFGYESPRRHYFNILGHFRDPIKWVRNPPRAIKHKLSAPASIVQEAMFGHDWANRRFTTYQELFGIDDKGVYETTSIRGGWRKGEPKGGKLRGRTVAWNYERQGPIRWDETPSWAISQLGGLTPVQIQAMTAFFAGQQDAFTTMARIGGVDISPEPGTEEELIAKAERRRGLR